MARSDIMSMSICHFQHDLQFMKVRSGVIMEGEGPKYTTVHCVDLVPCNKIAFLCLSSNIFCEENYLTNSLYLIINIKQATLFCKITHVQKLICLHFQPCQVTDCIHFFCLNKIVILREDIMLHCDNYITNTKLNSRDKSTNTNDETNTVAYF